MPHNGGGKGWATDPVTGKQTMPDIWRQFLEWLLLGPERMPSTQKEWAAENGTHEDTVRRWKRDPRFRKEWESRAAEMNVHIERVQGVIDAVYSEAVKGDIKAASLYLQYISAYTPVKKVVVDKGDAASMSDADLALELQEMLAGLGGGSDG
jgi:hypothetical protein